MDGVSSAALGRGYGILFASSRLRYAVTAASDRSECRAGPVSPELVTGEWGGLCGSRPWVWDPICLKPTYGMRLQQPLTAVSTGRIEC